MKNAGLQKILGVGIFHYDKIESVVENFDLYHNTKWVLESMKKYDGNIIHIFEVDGKENNSIEYRDTGYIQIKSAKDKDKVLFEGSISDIEEFREKLLARYE